MSEDSRRHRISFSRKILGGKVFVNESVEFDNPQDPEEVKRVIADLKSPGYTEIVDALADRLDEDGEAEIARVRGERRDRIGLAPLDPPKRVKTAVAPPAPSTMEQRNRIRAAVIAEDGDGTNIGKRNYLLAIMKREKVDMLDNLSYDGAEKVLSQIDPEVAAATEPEGFKPARDLAPREGATEEEEEEALRDAATHDHNLEAVKEGHSEEERRYTNLVEGPDGGELTGESKDVQLEVAKTEADEIDGVER